MHNGIGIARCIQPRLWLRLWRMIDDPKLVEKIRASGQNNSSRAASGQRQIEFRPFVMIQI